MWMLLMLMDHVFIKNMKKALEETGQLVAPPLDVPLAPITGCKTITENNFKDMAKKLRRKAVCHLLKQPLKNMYVYGRKKEMDTPRRFLTHALRSSEELYVINSLLCWRNVIVKPYVLLFDEHFQTVETFKSGLALSD